MRQVGFNRSCFLLQLVLSWECFMSITSSLRRLSLYLVFSLFLNPHPSNRVSCSVHALRISDRVHFERPPTRLWSFTGVSFFSFPIRSIFKIALSWRRDSILRPSERMHRRKSRAFSPKTTVSWPVNKVITY